MGLGDIILVSGDSGACPYDIGNWLSAGVYTSGQAVKRAAEDAKQQILSYAAEAFGKGIDELDIKNGNIFVKTNPEIKASFGDISRYGIQKLCDAIGTRIYTLPITPEKILRAIGNKRLWL